MFYKILVPLNANMDFCMRMCDQFYDQLYLETMIKENLYYGFSVLHMPRFSINLQVEYVIFWVLPNQLVKEFSGKEMLLRNPISEKNAEVDLHPGRPTPDWEM